jgi:hypothetical protein
VRKFLTAVSVAAIACAAFAVYALADPGTQHTSWTFTFSSQKKALPTGSNSIIEPAKRDDKGTADPSDDHYTEPKQSVIKFPVGSGIDTTVLPVCKASSSGLAKGSESCPSKTRIGSGLANSALGQPDAAPGSGKDVAAPIKAYNRKNAIVFVVDPCQPDTGPGKGKPCQPIPGGRVVLEGKWTKIATQPTLTVNTPPALIGHVIITRFQLKTNKITKKVKVNGKSVIKSYATTPGKCKGKWKSFAVESYTDGSKQTIPDTQACTK